MYVKEVVQVVVYVVVALLLLAVWRVLLCKRVKKVGFTYFVDPWHPNADDDNLGVYPEHPLATLAQAYKSVRSGSGDRVIFIAPGKKDS